MLGARAGGRPGCRSRRSPPPTCTTTSPPSPAGLAGGALYPQDAQLQPMRAAAALLAAARARGAEVRCGTELVGIERGAGGAVRGAVLLRRAPSRRRRSSTPPASGRPRWPGSAGAELPIAPRRGAILVTEPLAPADPPQGLRGRLRRRGEQRRRGPARQPGDRGHAQRHDPHRLQPRARRLRRRRARRGAAGAGRRGGGAVPRAGGRPRAARLPRLPPLLPRPPARDRGGPARSPACGTRAATRARASGSPRPRRSSSWPGSRRRRRRSTRGPSTRPASPRWPRERLRFDGEPVAAAPGQTIAAALLADGRRVLRRTRVTGAPARDVLRHRRVLRLPGGGQRAPRRARVPGRARPRATTCAPRRGRGEARPGVGGGPAGLAAARAATRAGARVSCSTATPGSAASTTAARTSPRPPGWRSTAACACGAPTRGSRTPPAPSGPPTRSCSPPAPTTGRCPSRAGTCPAC